MADNNVARLVSPRVKEWGYRHTDLSELLAPIVRTISEDERRQKDEEEPHHSKHCRSIGWDRTDPGWQPRTAHHWRSAQEAEDHLRAVYAADGKSGNNYDAYPELRRYAGSQVTSGPAARRYA